MPSIFDSLIEIIHSAALDSWKERNETALAGLFGTRYAKRAEKAVTLRAPDMRGSDSGVPYAAYIHPSNADAGAYGGMSFVIFPVEGEPCLVAMVIGTQGLAPDEAILGRPGHVAKNAGNRHVAESSVWPRRSGCLGQTRSHPYRHRCPRIRYGELGRPTSASSSGTAECCMLCTANRRSCRHGCRRHSNARPDVRRTRPHAVEGITTRTRSVRSPPGFRT